MAVGNLDDGGVQAVKGVQHLVARRKQVDSAATAGSKLGNQMALSSVSVWRLRKESPSVMVIRLTLARIIKADSNKIVQIPLLRGHHARLVYNTKT